MPAETVLALDGITKRFGPLLANDNISLALQRGEVLALLGENGAGKSTLMSILFGHYTADAGRITVFGKPLPPGQPQAALAAGIGMVHQHFTLADNLSVLDNVVIGTEPLWWPFTRRSAARQRLVETAQRFGLAVLPEARVADLSVGERQRVEILKALYRGAKVLILDEPTAVLTPQESEALFEVLGRMVAEGLSIIFISHKLAEVLRVSHRVAVLRGGQLVAQAPSASCSQAQLAQWMVGHEVQVRERQPSAGPGELVCQLQDVQVDQGRDRLHGVSLALRSREILAVAGVSGNGQLALADLLCGLRSARSGRVVFLGRPLPASPQQLVDLGVARVPEDRHAVGLMGDLPVWENACSERMRRPAFSRWGWVRRAAAARYTQQLMQRFDVRGAGPASAARALSGGNMQKLILGRALSPPDAARTGVTQASSDEPAIRLIVAHQPTWGLDVGAVAYVHQQLLAARDAGAAVLLISDDLDEVMALGDQIAVLYQGRVAGQRAAEAWSREDLGLAMAGASPKLSALDGAESVERHAA